jgi:DnaD/phage-associated family protein
MNGFSGFPPGKVRLTPVPSLFFSELLPAIDHLGELKVTLYCFWCLGQQAKEPRYLRERDLAADPTLMAGLRAPGISAEAVLAESLERATARGTLLRVGGGPAGDLFFMNSEKGREAVRALERGEWRPEGEPDLPLTLALERPNIFVLYEQNIGLLTPLLADELRDAERTYPPGWVEEAIRMAVERNARKWTYVRSILERWRTQGKDDGTTGRDSAQNRRRYIEGEFADYIEH